MAGRRATPRGAPLLAEDPRRIGDYWLAGRLGAGGQGVVYEAYDESGGRVALKAFHERVSGSPELRAQAGREVAAARRAASFCTARIVAADLDGPRPYIVSEFIEGPSLREVVRESGTYGGDELLWLATGVATALTAIHQSGVVHRDLKPGNVLIGPEGPRLIDFGIARTDDMTLTATEGVIGTPGYTAPEVLRGERATPAADVFAWGVAVVFAATGRSPFGAPDFPASLRRILADDLDLGGLGEPLRALVRRALSVAPDDRPTAPELLLALTGGADAAAMLGEGSRIAAAVRPPESHAPDPSLHDRAERACLDVAEDDRPLVPLLLLGLVGADGEPRPVPRAELRAAGPPGSAAALDRILGVFTAAGLIAIDGEECSLATPALPHTWPRLRGWIADDREGLRVRDELARGARLWDEHGRKPGDLLQGTALASTARFATTQRTRVGLGGRAQDFLAASRARERRRAHARRAAAAATAVFLVLSLIAVGVIENQRRAIERQRNAAWARSVAARADAVRTDDPRAAMLLSAAAWRLAEINDARGPVLAARFQQDVAVRELPAPGVRTRALLLGADGQRILHHDYSDAGFAEFLDVPSLRKHRIDLTGAPDEHGLVAASPDGGLAVIWTGASTTLWDLEKGRAAGEPVPALIHRLPTRGIGVSKALEGPDPVRLWDLRAGEPVPGPPGGLQAGVSADGRRAAIVTDATHVEVWDLPERRRLSTIEIFEPLLEGEPGEEFVAPAFTRDGRTVALAYGQGEVGLWDAATGREHMHMTDGRITGTLGGVVSLAFNADGRFLLGNSPADGVRMWRTDGMVETFARDAKAGQAAFGPGDRTLVVVDGDAQGSWLRVFDVSRHTRPEAVLTYPAASEDDHRGAFSPDGRLFARRDRSSVRTWNLDTGRPVGPPVPNEVTGVEPDLLVRFTPDGRTVVDSHLPSGLRFLDPETGRATRTLGPAYTGEGPSPSSSVSFGRDGERVAYTVDGGRTTLIRELPSGRLLLRSPAEGDWGMALMRPDGEAIIVQTSEDVHLVTVPDGKRRDLFESPWGGVSAQSPDGRLLAYHGPAAVRLFDMESGRMLEPGFPLDDQGIVLMSFTPDGRFLVTGDSKGRVRLWDVETRRPLTGLIPLHNGPLLDLAFRDGGARLLTAGTDGTVRETSLDPADAVREICDRAGGDLTEAEWRRYVPDVPYRTVCG
ncbi:WD40 repeat domain-containing serine/threonine protein kinase [Actinomadura rifamycini]|uniref:WD40 repeat domain-containing serine/threonine protein kinase n=1 Tax=Actinomadura rifamycini TaxID=31962 RepID=UPI00041BD8CF|nr:serine/threonine-protein kinase [Actinomadura rifamycini]